MKWREFCGKYLSMSDTVLKLRIPSLEDMGCGNDVAEVVTDLESRSARAQLVQRAIELGVSFTPADCFKLDGEIPTPVLVGLIKRGKITFTNVNVLASLLSGMWDEDAKTALYNRALRSGIKFTAKHLDTIGKIKTHVNENVVVQPQRKGSVSLGTILGYRLKYGSSLSDKKTKK